MKRNLQKGPAIATIPRVALRVGLTVYCPFDGGVAPLV